MEPSQARATYLGRCDYESAYALQLEILEKKKQEEKHLDEVLFVEHDHVITLGRNRDAATNVLQAGEIPVLQIERGGNVTYHGPGQLVAYPILLLREGERDLHRYLRNLEEAVILTLDKFGISGGRKEGATGVWIGERKIASMGIACRKWITFHGLSLNVNCDLDYFHRINPCGFEASVMTSMVNEGVSVTPKEVLPELQRSLGTTLKRRFVPTPFQWE